LYFVRFIKFGCLTRSDFHTRVSFRILRRETPFRVFVCAASIDAMDSASPRNRGLIRKPAKHLSGSAWPPR
ncbi:hypothetical protein ABLN64_15870, partial [Mycobacterium tuberculosis]